MQHQTRKVVYCMWKESRKMGLYVGICHAPIEACKIMFNWRVAGVKDKEIAQAVGSWIDRVLECHAQSLRVDVEDARSPEPYVQMGDMSLVSQHLTRLELNCICFLGDDSGCLNFSGCSVLEHLEVTNDLGCLKMITSPSVKRLVIIDFTSSQFHRDLRICFPLLVSLCLQGCFHNTPVLESMPHLAVAYVSTDERYSVGCLDYESGEDFTKCMVLEGLAHAKHLVLLSEEETVH